MSGRLLCTLYLALSLLLVGCAGPSAPTTPTRSAPSFPASGVAPTPTRASATASIATRTSASAPIPVPTPTPSASPVAPPNDPAALWVELQAIARGLQEPIGLAVAGDGSGRLFIVEKAGRVRVLQNGKLSGVPFLDITDRVGSQGSEQGLLGLVFHPLYRRNGLLYVNYTDRQGNTSISRFSVSHDPGQADPASEVVVLTQDQPAPNHNGGQLAFGPDGFLYVGLGDGGREGDPFGNGQNRQTLLGKLLRLDVDSGQPYSVPQDNPFAGDSAVRHEIWAIGLRNPWRFSFDRLTGDLYIADVGQDTYEEIDFQPAHSRGGQNYGWSIMEGMHCYPADRACDRTGLTLPVAEYDHSQGCSVIGGYVYRGKQFPLLSGIYLLGDYCSGRIWGLARDGQGQWRMAQLGQASMRLSSFGEDEAGELYLVDMRGGVLFSITALPRQ